MLGPPMPVLLELVSSIDEAVVLMKNLDAEFTQYKRNMEDHGICSDEREGHTASKAGWACHKQQQEQEPTETDKQLKRLADQMTKLAKVLAEPTITVQPDRRLQSLRLRS